MFAGLFVVLAGLSSTGALDPMVDGVAALGSGDGLSTLGGVAAAASGLSNAISNVPAVLVLAPAADALASDRVWLALAASSTMAGNATLVGAAANLIVAQRAQQDGVELTWRRFMRVGLPVSAVTVAVSTLALWAVPL
jgi:Na+/H+ antiporter NhaD/arsenite permease-like protein